MFITNLIKQAFKKQCRHDKILPTMEQGYCPDCGKFIRNEWYITRCSCCGVKMKAIVQNGKVIPQEHFCANCGSKNFTVEKVDKINFIDINFAVLIKKELTEVKKQFATQLWQENTIEPLKLTLKC